jgi:translation elongation factor EF-Ts
VRTAARNTAVIGAGIITGIGVGVKSGINSLAELEDAVTSVNGALANAGLQGQVTGAQVAGWANDIEREIGAAFDDKDITAATATLVRFGKVTPKNLQPAMRVMTDLAVKTGSVDSAASLLAKALADPTKAAGKLAKNGIILTKAQQDTIKAMVEANDVAGAQALILREVEETTKGAAAASQGPYRRSLSVLADVTEDAQRALGEGFLPVITKVSEILQGELAKPGTMNNIREFGKGLASGLDDLIDIARNLPWGAIGTSLQVAGAGAKTILSAFSSLPPWLQTAVVTGWGLNKLTGGALGSIAGELGKGLIKGVLGMQAGVVHIQAGVVNGGGVPGAAGAAGSAAPVAAAGMSSLAALSIGLPALGAAIVGAVNSPLWVDNQTLAAKLEQQGLTQGERAAQIYFNASTSEQAEMRKRIANLPTLADFQSGNAKLQTTGDNTTDAALETKRETNRSGGIIASTTRSSSLTNASIISASIARNRAIVNTSVAVYVSGTSVTTSVTKTQRSGGGGSSRETDKNAAKHV